MSFEQQLPEKQKGKVQGEQRQGLASSLDVQVHPLGTTSILGANKQRR